jgi:hypothetical protein
MESGPICQNVQISDLPFLKIKDCMVEHSWDVDLVVQLVSQEVADDIFSQIDGTKPGMDRLIWLGSKGWEIFNKNCLGLASYFGSKVPMDKLDLALCFTKKKIQLLCGS